MASATPPLSVSYFTVLDKTNTGDNRFSTPIKAPDGWHFQISKNSGRKNIKVQTYIRLLPDESQKKYLDIDEAFNSLPPRIWIQIRNIDKLYWGMNLGSAFGKNFQSTLSLEEKAKLKQILSITDYNHGTKSSLLIGNLYEEGIFFDRVLSNIDINRLHSLIKNMNEQNRSTGFMPAKINNKLYWCFKSNKNRWAPMKLYCTDGVSQSTTNIRQILDHKIKNIQLPSIYSNEIDPDVLEHQLKANEFMNDLIAQTNLLAEEMKEFKNKAFNFEYPYEDVVALKKRTTKILNFVTVMLKGDHKNAPRLTRKKIK